MRGEPGSRDRKICGSQNRSDLRGESRAAGPPASGLRGNTAQLPTCLPLWPCDPCWCNSFPPTRFFILFNAPALFCRAAAIAKTLLASGARNPMRSQPSIRSQARQASLGCALSGQTQELAFEEQVWGEEGAGGRLSEQKVITSVRHWGGGQAA